MHELDTIARRTLDSFDGERPSVTKVAARAQARKRRRNTIRAAASGVLVFLLFFGGFLLLGSPGETAVDTAGRPGSRSELSPIRVNGDPIFDVASSQRLFLGSIAGADQDFVRCMAAEGFEVSVLDGVSFFSAEYLMALQNGDERAFAEEWGFGLFSVNLLPSSPASARVGPQEPPEMSEGDPYYDAAFGGFFGELGLFGGGCRGEADDLWRDGERQTPFEEIREITDLFVLDGRVVEHYSDFSACMTALGFSVTSPLDAYEQTVDELEFVFGNDRPISERQAALVEEVELGVATVDCGESATDLVSPALRPVWEEYAPDGWDGNDFHIAAPDCLGNAAYDLDLAALLTVEATEALFPDSCFE